MASEDAKSVGTFTNIVYYYMYKIKHFVHMWSLYSHVYVLHVRNIWEKHVVHIVHNEYIFSCVVRLEFYNKMHTSY